MALTRFSTTSTEYVICPVAAVLNGATYDPRADTVQFAFTTGVAAPVTWLAGSWDTGNAVAGQWYARCLIGPGGVVQLATGVWIVWLKITDSPEIIVRQAGQIQVA